MKRLISLLLCALLIVPVLAEDAPDFEPIPWDIKVSPNLPNPDCYLPNNGGYHDDSIDIQIDITYWTQDLQQVDAPGEGTTTVMSARVKLTNPDVTVHLEVEDDRLLLIKGRYEGIGGFPIGTQEDVLSLISGGFDSGVSSYMLMRRGCRVHYCFFNLGGAAHEIGVRQVAHYLWNRFGSSHRVRFVAINFEPVVGEILEKIDDGVGTQHRRDPRAEHRVPVPVCALS